MKARVCSSEGVEQEKLEFEKRKVGTASAGECQGTFETNNRVAEQLQGPSGNGSAGIPTGPLGPPSGAVLGLWEQTGREDSGGGGSQRQ